MTKTDLKSQSADGALWSATESFHQTGFGRSEPFREQEFRNFLAESYQKLFDAHRDACAVFAERLAGNFGIQCDTQKLRADFVAHLFATGENPVEALKAHPEKISGECAELSPERLRKLVRIIDRSFAGVESRAAYLRDAGLALDFIPSQIEGLTEDDRRITEYVALASSRAVAQAMLVIGERPTFEEVLKRELSHTRLFSEGAREWMPENAALADFGERTALAHGRVLTQRVRFVPDFPAEGGTQWYMGFDPVKIGTYSSNFGFLRRDVKSADPAIERPLMVFAPIRTLDPEVLEMLERYGSEIPGAACESALNRSILRRLETVTNFSSHDYVHSAVYSIDSSVRKEGSKLDEYYFSNGEAPIYRSTPRAEYQEWSISADRTGVTHLEQFSLRSHKATTDALIDKHPGIKERLLEQAVYYLQDVGTLMREVEDGAGRERSQNVGRYLTALYMRELWLLFPHDDAALSAETRGGSSVNTAIRSLNSAPYALSTADCYQFLEREGVLPPVLLAKRQGATWHAIVKEMETADRFTFARFGIEYQDAGLMPAPGHAEWSAYMEKMSPGWTASAQSLERDLEGAAPDAQHAARLKFHAKNSAAAIALLSKAQYLAFRCGENQRNVVPAFSKEQLLSAVAGWKVSDGWQAGSPAEKLMLRSLFPPSGPGAEEKAVLLRVLSARADEGIWGIAKGADFVLTYNRSPEERAWMAADLERFFGGARAPDSRYHLLVKELHAAMNPARRRGAEFFNPVPDERGLWLELSIREYGILPWLHGNSLGPPAESMLKYGAVIGSPTLEADGELIKAKSAFARAGEPEPAVGRFEYAVRWLKRVVAD